MVGDFFKLFANTEIEVIGNIYENPELLFILNYTIHLIQKMD